MGVCRIGCNGITFEASVDPGSDIYVSRETVCLPLRCVPFSPVPETIREKGIDRVSVDVSLRVLEVAPDALFPESFYRLNMRFEPGDRFVLTVNRDAAHDWITMIKDACDDSWIFRSWDTTFYDQVVEFGRESFEKALSAPLSGERVPESSGQTLKGACGRD